MLHPYAHYLRRAALLFPDRPAVADPARDVELTWRELADRVARRAATLARAGVGPGDRVLVRQANTHGYLEAVLAAAWRGAAYVPVLGVLSAGERHYIEETVEPVAVLDAAYPGPPGDHGGEAPVDVPPGAASQVLFTSGSSGRPKGVVHSFDSTAGAMGAWAAVTKAGPDQVVLVTTPMSHAAGRLVESALVAGGRVVIAESPKPGPVAAAIERYGVTHMLLVPTVLQDLVDGAAGGDLSSLRQVVYSSAPASPSLVRRAHERLGPVVASVYGSTEVPAPVTVLDTADHERAMAGAAHLLTSCGREHPWGVQTRIVDDDLREVPPGEVGQLALCTPWLASGYWRQPDAWAERLRDGWFLTGDLGRYEDGYLYLVDRRDDMIISGGYNVFPTEVEHVLGEHPSVREVAVFGAPDGRWGEAVVAAVALRQPAPADPPAALIAHCRDHLPRYKVPKRIVVLDDLPKSGHGKLSRRLTRQRVVGDSAVVHGAE